MDIKDNIKTYKVRGFSPRSGCATTTYTLVNDRLPEQNEDELICLHPSTPKTFRIEDGRHDDEKNIYVDVPADHNNTVNHIHAVRCRCSKCSNIMSSLMDTITKDKEVDVKTYEDEQGSPTTVITTQ